MGDFSDGYEMGLWGLDGIPYDLGDDSDNEIESSNKIIVELTPGKYLSSEGRYLRAKLTNNELEDSDIILEVLHDKSNDNDPLALEVFCNRISIGYIQKYSSTIDIDDFCFLDNSNKRKLHLDWRDNRFSLLRKFSGTTYMRHVVPTAKELIKAPVSAYEGYLVETGVSEAEAHKRAFDFTEKDLATIVQQGSKASGKFIASLAEGWDDDEQPKPKAKAKK